MRIGAHITHALRGRKGGREETANNLRNINASVNAAIGFKYEEPCVINKLITARDKEEIIDQHLNP